MTYHYYEARPASVGREAKIAAQRARETVRRQLGESVAAVDLCWLVEGVCASPTTYDRAKPILGCCLMHEPGVIYVWAAASPQTIWETFLHECYHAFSARLGYCDELSGTQRSKYLEEGAEAFVAKVLADQERDFGKRVAGEPRDWSAWERDRLAAYKPAAPRNRTSRPAARSPRPRIPEGYEDFAAALVGYQRVLGRVSAIRASRPCGLACMDQKPRRASSAACCSGSGTQCPNGRIASHTLAAAKGGLSSAYHRYWECTPPGFAK